MKLRIEPSRGWTSLKLREVWQYRELIYFFVLRDITVRYRQTVIGALWAIIQPFTMMVVFSIIFGKLAKVPSENVPYPIFAYTALLPWNYFASALNGSSNSLVGNANLLRKIYFPRLIIPISAVVVGLVDFAIAFLILIGMIFFYKIQLTWQIIAIPFLMLMAIGSALGVGLWLSALNVRYRDVRHIVPFLIQIWMFATPVVYPSGLIKSEILRSIYSINPMVSVVEGFRWALLGTTSINFSMFGVSLAVILILLIGGLFFFRSMERTFADVV